MEETANQKKNRLLGEPHGTANSRLRKMLLFECVKMLGADRCYRCGKPILTLREFSIEHTVPWQGTENPRETFFDLSKIAYSHLSCNTSAGNGSKKYASNKESNRAKYERLKANIPRYEKKLASKRKKPTPL